MLSDWQRLQCCEPYSPFNNEPLKKPHTCSYGCSKTKGQIKSCFKYSGFSAGFVGRSFRIWEDPVLKPYPWPLLRNNGGRRYLTTSSHFHLKKNRMAKGETKRESFPGWPASIQLLKTKLHWNASCCLELDASFLASWKTGFEGLWGFCFVLGFCCVEQSTGKLSSTLCNGKARTY